MDELNFLQLAVAVLLGMGGMKGIEVGIRKINGGPPSCLGSDDRAILTAMIEIQSQKLSKEICDAIRDLEMAVRDRTR